MRWLRIAPLRTLRRGLRAAGAGVKSNSSRVGSISSDRFHDSSAEIWGRSLPRTCRQGQSATEQWRWTGGPVGGSTGTQRLAPQGPQGISPRRWVVCRVVAADRYRPADRRRRGGPLQTETTFQIPARRGLSGGEDRIHPRAVTGSIGATRPPRTDGGGVDSRASTGPPSSP